MESYFNPHNIRESPKQEPVEPTLCRKCGNKHVGEFCAAKITDFVWKKPATEVFLVGEWSKWQYYEQLKKQPDDTFAIGLNLRIGVYTYKFIVDGKWTYDDQQPRVSDNYGSFNNIKEIYPITAYTQNQDFEGPDTKILSTIKDNNLKIIGSWDNWKNHLEMKEVFNHLKNCRQYEISLKLEPGKKYEFKFIANGKYLTDPSYPAISNNLGGFNNLIIVSFGDGHETPKIRMKKRQMTEINIKEWVWESQKLEDFPYHNIYGHKINIVGDHVYMVGGNDKGCYKNWIIKISLDTYICEVETFDEEEFPARAYHHAKIYGNKLLIYGGVGNHVILNDYLSYNTSTKEWGVPPKIRGTPPENREKNSSILFKDLFIFFGGYLWTPDLEFQFIYNDISILDLTDMVWLEVPEILGDKPKARYAHSATLSNEYMYIFGGVINPAEILSTNDVWRLKLSAQAKLEWQQIKMNGKPPAPRYGHSATLVNQMIAIFGGMGDKSVMYNDLFFLDIKNHSWIHPAMSGEVPRPRYYHHAGAVNDQQIIILGGKTVKGFKNQNAYILKPDFSPKPLQL